MHREPTAYDIEAVARRDKGSFQRMAVDLLRAQAAGGAGIRGYDLGTGRNDHGFDAEIDGSFEGLIGRIRVSVKGNLYWSNLRKDARADARRHPELPLLLVCALPLDDEQVKMLRMDAHDAGVPTVQVVHGSTLAEWLRDSPHLAQVYLRAEASALVPVEQALVRFAPRVPGRNEAGPWLRSEIAAVEAIQASLEEKAGVVLLAFQPDTRPERCLWRLAHELARTAANEALLWVHTSKPAPLPADAWTSPAFSRRPQLFLAPWGSSAQDLVRWFGTLPVPESGPHRLVLAVPSALQADVRYQIQADGRSASDPERVELGLPADVHELDALVAWLLPTLQTEVRRQSFSETYGRRPALIELGARSPELLAARGGIAFPDPIELRALAGIALLGGWPAQEPARGWLLGWLDCDAAALDALALRAEQGGWLVASRLVHVPASRAVRWALVRAWKQRDQVAWTRLAQSLREVPREILQVLLPGMAEVELYEEVEQFLLGELDQATWQEWGTHLPVLARSGPKLHSRILTLAATDLRHRPERVDLHTVAEVVQLTPLFADNLNLALRVCTLLGRAGLSSPYSNSGPPGLIEKITAPHRLNPRRARRALGWLPEAVARSEFDVALAGPFVGAWLKTGVGVEESSNFSLTFGTSGWNEANPDLPACWQGAANMVKWLLGSDDPEVRLAGWDLLQSAGAEVRLGPSPPDLRVPPALVDTVGRLIDAAAARLPLESAWHMRHRAERALLFATEREHVDVDLAAEVLGRFSTDPLFRAWQLCVDRREALPDPQGYTKVRTAEGPDAARRWRFNRGDAVLDSRVGDVADRLVAAGHDTASLLKLLQAIDVEVQRKPQSSSGFEMLRAWAERTPLVFEPVIFGREWARVPTDLQGHLLLAVAPVFGVRLLGRQAAPDTVPPVDGAAHQFMGLLNDPASTPGEETRRLLPALEGVLPAAEVMTTLLHLAGHAHPWVRYDLGTWLFRHLLRHEVGPTEIKAAVQRLCRAPGGLPAIEALLTTVGHKEGQHKSLLWEELLAAFLAHVHGQPDRDGWSLVVREEYSFRPLVWETLKRAPELWWIIVDERTVSDEHGFGDMHKRFREVPIDVTSEDLALAVQKCPFPLNQAMNRRARIVDALVSGLTATDLQRLASTLEAQGRVDDVRALLISAGARPEMALLIAEVGSRFGDESALQKWALRVAFGGLLGIHSFGPYRGDLPERPAADPRAEALRAQARKLGGRREYVLDLVADGLER